MLFTYRHEDIQFEVCLEIYNGDTQLEQRNDFVLAKLIVIPFGAEHVETHWFMLPLTIYMFEAQEF